jgi:hypothetical protein
MRAPARLPRQNEMSDLLEYVAVAGGLGSDWAVAGDAIGNGHPNKSPNQNWGSHTEFTVAQAGINGVARRSLSAWRGKPADPPRTAIRSSGSTGPHLRSHQLE